MEAGIASLSYTVRPRVLGKFLGQIAGMLGALTIVPLLVSLLYQEYRFTTRLAVISTLLLLAGGWLSRLPTPEQVQRNEALSLVALAFVLAPLCMIYPMMAAGLTPLDALFEAVSGVTTTGLSVLPHIAEQPHTLLFLRAWMQWYGGLGIVVLSIALLMGHHAAVRRLAEPAVGESLATTARIHARRMLIVYVSLTVAGGLLLWALGLNGFSAVTHVLAAVSTGGFSPLEHSLGDLTDWTQRFAVIGLSLLGAVPLALYYRVALRDWRALWQDAELRTLLIAGALCSALVAWSLYRAHGDMAGLWPQAILLGLSAQTTTGFSVLPVQALDHFGLLVLILAMSLGGGLGSTAGGIKLLRLLVIMRVLHHSLRRSAMPPHAVSTPRLMGKPLEDEDIVQAMTLVLLFAAVVVLSWLAFLAGGYPPLDALFEVVSATATVGLSTGITSHALSPALKLVLCLDMWLGRVEILALLVLCYPRTWFGKRSEHP